MAPGPVSQSKRNVEGPRLVGLTETHHHHHHHHKQTQEEGARREQDWSRGGRGGVDTQSLLLTAWVSF